MAEDMNINIRNQLGGKSNAKQKISAKGSIRRAKSTMRTSLMPKKLTSSLKGAMNHANSGSSANMLSSVSAVSKGAGITMAFVASLTMASIKIAKFGININEAQTGDRVWSNNANATLKTITSLGTNYLYGGIHNELFTKRKISRQNYGLDYYREIYQLNMEGYKNKRI